MADPYLEALEQILLDGVHDLHDAAVRLHPDLSLDEAFASTCATFNNGLLKGFWSISVPGESLGANCVVVKTTNGGE